LIEMAMLPGSDTGSLDPRCAPTGMTSEERTHAERDAAG
jgi:hypothetical protein